jgi:transcriptional regulator with XRE-family HTH domain
MTDDPWKEQMVALGGFIRGRRAVAGLSLRELAERTAVSNAYLSQVERGLHEPSLRVLHAIATALAVPLDLLLAHARLVPDAAERAPLMDTEAAIREDPRLTDAQRFALLSVYRSFLAAGG